MAKDDSNGFGTMGRPNNGQTRIKYVEPNDIYGEINGVPVTPDYTDYCIYCNLIVEKYSRIKSGSSGQSNNSNMTTYNYYWDATKTDGTHWITFMEGKQDGPDYNYLTTDYTEIDFNEVKQRNFIEGLGIESVSITMNNYYVPEITINFVDVRGSGFFSREEATHDTFDLINLEKDQYGNLTDNFYSCFVSFPYPRFKLQVKGFYGNPVTYQLTCSSFSGSLDSATGNFKLTAKFIGYFYGIMADIPYEYLVAAPLCSYEGQDYWDAHVNEEAWQLDDNRPPVKLHDFYDLVSNAMQTVEGRARLMGNANNEALDNYKAMATKLNLVKTTLGEFKTELKKEFKTSFECNTPNSNQLILVSETQKVTIPNRVCERYKIFINVLDEYTKEFGSSYKTEKGETLDNSKRPGTQEDKWTSGEVALTEFFSANDGKLFCKLNGKKITETSTTLKDLYLPTCSPSNGDGAKTTKLSEDISNAIKNDTSKHSNIILKGWLFACAIDFNCIETTIADIETKLALDLKKIENELSEKQTQSIISYFGFAPYVGNFFKIVMCHLETFVAIMYKVAEKIDKQIANQDREPNKLGIAIRQTDVPDKLNFIPAWPAVYKDKAPYDPTNSEAEDPTTRYETFGDDSDIRGWVGDAAGTVEWEERTMLMAFYNALIKVITPNDGDGTDLAASAPLIMDNIYPSIPSDLYTGVPKYATESKQKFAAYLGIRLMQICALYNRGNVSERYAKAFAILDAYNFFKQTDHYAVKSLVTPSKGSTIGDELYDLMLAKETGQPQHLSYEFTNVVNDRHPIFVENGNDLSYTYMKTKNGIPILPITVNNLTQAEIHKHFKDEGNGKFTPEYEAQNRYSQLGNGFQYTGTTKNLLNNYSEYDRNVLKNEYQNPSLFYTVIENDAQILDRYYEMFTSGDFSTDNSELDTILTENKKTFADYAAKYWKKIEEDEYLQDNSVGTVKSFKLKKLKDIKTKENIRSILGKRKTGY